MNPLTPEEVTELAECVDPDCSSSEYHQAIRQLQATIRDRERERDEQQKRADDWREQFVNRLESIVQLTRERDELQRKLDGWRELGIETVADMTKVQRLIALIHKIASPVREEEGGTE